MRRVILFVFEGPRRPWVLTPLCVVLYPMAWYVYVSKHPHGWVWFIPYTLLLWWQVQRFLEVGHYNRLSQRTFDWTCPVCKYPLAKLKNDHDPRTSRCPECGHIPAEVIKDAKEKAKRAAKW